MNETSAVPLLASPWRLRDWWRTLTLVAGMTLASPVAPPVAALPSGVSQDPAAEPERGNGRLWNPVAEDMLGAPDPSRRIESRDYRTLSLDRSQLADVLARAPRRRPEHVGQSEVIVELPWPDASFRSFWIEEVSITEPGLKVRCPDLKTYLGQTLDRLAWVNFDWSSSGLHAVMSSGQGVVHIRPYSRGDTSNYITYYSRDWKPGPEQAQGLASSRQAVPARPRAVLASPAQPSAASIEEIMIERGCFRCANQYRLTLRRDGTATLITVGVLGVEHMCRGSVAPAEFARLAALMQGQGFFELKETYRDPRTMDGQSVTTSAIVGSRRTAVENSNHAGPPTLKQIEDAINALGEKATWMETAP